MSGPNGSGGIAGLSSEELRAAVRAVLQEVLPASAAGGRAPAAAGERVTLRSDADLDAFVRRVAALCEDPAQRNALREGRHAFRLAGAGADAGPSDATAPAGGVPAGMQGVVRVERGAVTERAVLRAAKDGARLLIGPRAVLTPLARDKARSLGVVVEKER